MERKDDRMSNIEIQTPAILKSYKRTSRSPNSMIRSHLPPSKSGLLQQLFQVPNKVSTGDGQNSVIVFGYPQKMKETVLDRFKKLGYVEEYKLGGGNWMTITYSDSSSVYKALAFNSQLIADNIIIGVKLPNPQEFDKTRGTILSTPVEVQGSSQYLKKTPRRKADFYHKFVTYILNIDLDY
jgi:Nup53/35/40-type RNA recognition motif